MGSVKMAEDETVRNCPGNGDRVHTEVCRKYDSCVEIGFSVDQNSTSFIF